MENQLKETSLHHPEAEDISTPKGFLHLSEEERLWIDMNRSDMEKFHLFTQMLRRNKMIAKMEIKHIDETSF